MLGNSLTTVLYVLLGSICVYSLPTNEEALLAKLRAEVLAQDLVNCTSALKLEADAKENSANNAQKVRIFRNLEEIDGFDEDDAFALEEDDEDSHFEDRDKRQCTLTDVSGCAITTVGGTVLYTMQIRQRTCANKPRINLFRLYARRPGTFIFTFNNQRGAFVYVMRTYMRNQVISFPLGVHVSWSTRGFLYLQSTKSSYGWKKIGLEEVLNGYKKNTACDGTNGAYRLMKTARNYAALELARPFNASGYTRLGGCFFFRTNIHKITDPIEEPQMLDENELSYIETSHPELVEVDSAIGFGDAVIVSGNNLGTDQFGDKITEIPTHGDLNGGVANEVANNAEIKTSVVSWASR